MEYSKRNGRMKCGTNSKYLLYYINILLYCYIVILLYYHCYIVRVHLKDFSLYRYAPRNHSLRIMI